MTHIKNLERFEDADRLDEAISHLLKMLLINKFKDAQALLMEKEFTKGKTPTRVFLAKLVESAEADSEHYQPLILKVGQAKLLRKEIEAFISIREFIEDKGLFAKLLEAEKCLEKMADENTLSAIAYTYTTDQVDGQNVISLESLCMDFIREYNDWESIRKVLGRVFKSLDTFKKKPEFTKKAAITDYYLSHWAPNFEVKANYYKWLEKSKQHLFTTGTNIETYQESYFIKQEKSPPKTLARESEDPQSRLKDVIIQGLEYQNYKDEIVSLKATSSNMVRFKLDISTLSGKNTAVEKISADDNQQVALFTPKGKSRRDFYLERLKTVFPGVDFRLSSFNLGQTIVRNPLTALSKPLNEKIPRKTRMIPAHGDLHAGNIKVVDGTPTFFDYGMSEPSLPDGIDLVRLLGSLIIKAVAPLMDFEELKTVFLTAFTPGKTASPRLKPAQTRAIQLLDYIKEHILESLDEDAFWLHVYGFAWIALKWRDWDDDHQEQSALRAAYLMAAMANTQVTGLPDSTDEPFLLKVYSEDHEETAGEAPGDHPLNAVLDNWVTRLEQEHSQAMVVAGLNGRESRLAMVKLLDRLYRVGLPLKAKDTALLLAAIHLNSIALWLNPGHEEVRRKCGLLSADILKERQSELLDLGLDEMDLAALESLLRAFPGFEPVAGDEGIRAIAALACLIYALTWGDERLPEGNRIRELNLNFNEKNPFRHQWARQLSMVSPVNGDCLTMSRDDRNIAISITPVVKTVYHKFADEITNEATAWLRYLLDNAGLSAALQKHWNLTVNIEARVIKRARSIARGKLDAVKILEEEHRSRWQPAQTSQYYPLPGVLESPPLRSSAAKQDKTLERLNQDFFKARVKSDGREFLGGEFTQWPDILGDWDAPRQRTMEFVQLLEKRLRPGRMTIVWLHSAAGNGKSTVLMRMAYQLAKRKKLEVWWRPQNIDPAQALDTERLEKLRGPAVVFLDDGQLIPNLKKTLLALAHRARDKAPVHFVIAYQGVNWRRDRMRNLGRENRLIENRDYPLDRLSPNEAQSIIKKLVTSGLVEQGADTEVLANRLSQRDRKYTDLLTAMLMVVKNVQNFDAIIHQFLDKLKDANLKRAIVLVSAVCRLSPKNYFAVELLQDLMGMPSDVFKTRVQEPLYAELRPLMAGRDDRQLVSRGILVADKIYRYILEKNWFLMEDIYIDIIMGALEYGRFTGNRWAFKVCTSILENLKCRDLRRLCYRRIMESHFPDPYFLQTWALMEAREGRLELARLLYFKAATLNPDNAPPWQAWALMEERLGDSNKARILFERGTKADTRHAPLWQAWAVMEERLGDSNKARILFERGTKADPKDAVTWQAWALMEERLGEFTIAHKYMEKSRPFIKGNEKSSSIYREFMNRHKRRQAGEEVAATKLSKPEVKPPSNPKAPGLKSRGHASSDGQDTAPSLDFYDAMSNETLDSEIRRLLDLPHHPPGGISCPHGTPCLSGTCSYPDKHHNKK